MLKTDYIKAFTKAIEEADLENEIVVRNLENALVMASAKYEGGKCANIEKALIIKPPTWISCTYPTWNFPERQYKIKPIPQYKPFDVESFKPYRDCWFMSNGSDLIFKVVNYYDEGITVALYNDKLTSYSWEYFMDNFTLDGKPAGVEITI